MPETAQQNTISDKAPKPSGLVPKNLQAFVLVGLALVMVLIMAITGHKSTVIPAAQTPSSVPTPLPLNTEKVSEFEKRIEDAQRSTAPQAEAALLRQQKQLAAEGTASAQPLPPSPYGTPVTSSNATGAYPPGAYASALPQPTEGEQGDPFKTESKKRQYMSLFADNVALTYRKDASAAASPVTPASITAESVTQDPLTSQALAELARQSQLLAQVQRSAAPAQSAQVASTPTPASTARSTMATPQTLGTGENSATRSALPIESVTDRNRNYVLFEGTILESVFMNRLDGSFSGPVECLISNDIYSHDRQHVLIPAGSKVLGEAAKVDSFGQARLAVTFHRLIMPDGFSVNLDQFKGLDQFGATALRDKVNNHYAKIFGASLALGVLGGVSQAGTGTVLNSTAEDRMRQGFGAGLANAGDHILDHFLNILPTITIWEGTRVKIYLSADLLLPDYHDHHLPPSL